MAGISISMLSGDNSILQRATDAKQISERAEAKEQAKMDIMAWVTDKTANHEDATLDDTKVKGILTGKSYVKSADSTSFITAKGEYIIQYSELYQTSPNNITDESSNLYNEFKDKNVEEIFAGLKINEIDTNFLDATDGIGLIEYNNKVYIVYFTEEGAVSSVVLSDIDLSSFNEYTITEEYKVLVTPNTADNLIHFANYEGPINLSNNMYYVKTDGNLSLSRKYYKAEDYDRERDYVVEHYYDDAGNLLDKDSLIEVEGPTSFTSLYYISEVPGVGADLNHPFTNGYYSPTNRNYYDTNGIHVNIKSDK